VNKIGIATPRFVFCVFREDIGDVQKWMGDTRIDPIEKEIPASVESDISQMEIPMHEASGYPALLEFTGHCGEPGREFMQAPHFEIIKC
jgi:hypothetical protein